MQLDWDNLYNLSPNAQLQNIADAGGSIPPSGPSCIHDNPDLSHKAGIG